MAILVLGSLWLAWSLVESVRDKDSAWRLFAASYVGGICLYAVVHVTLGPRLRRIGTRHLTLFQASGLLLAVAFFIWKPSASPDQLLVVAGILGGAALFITVWFARFLLARGDLLVRQGLVAVLIVGAMLALLSGAIAVFTRVIDVVSRQLR